MDGVLEQHEVEVVDCTLGLCGVEVEAVVVDCRKVENVVEMVVGVEVVEVYIEEVVLLVWVVV